MIGDLIIRSITIVAVVCILAYFVPGLVLRAIKDFKIRYGGGDYGKTQMEERVDERQPEEER